MASQLIKSIREIRLLEGSRVARALKSFREQSEDERPFVPVIGGPRVFVLLLYASVVVIASIEFFMSRELWYGSWEVFNTYVFTVTGLFVFFGLLMMFSAKDVTGGQDFVLPFPRFTLGVIGLGMLAGSAIAIVVGGSGLGGTSVVLSVVLLYGFVFMVLGSKGVTKDEGIRLGLFGSGLVLMALVPVHEAFAVAPSPAGEYPFTLLNLILLVPGAFLSLFALQALRTRDGFLGAWLMGAMLIFLIAFHEQIGLVSSDNYEPYDRTLALVGITFSFLPLAIYAWREREYTILWSNLKAANAMVERGKYAEALDFTDKAIQKCSRVAIMDRFSLPWSLKADVLYRMRDYSKARSYYDVALEIDPRDSVSWTHLGCIHAYTGKKQPALTAFDNAIRHDLHNAIAWNNKGAVLQSLGLLAEAMECFERAALIDDNSFDAHFNLGKAYARLGRSDEAVVHFQRAYDLRPDSDDTVEWLQREFYRGMCLDQINGWAQLGLDTSYLRTILDTDPENFIERSREFLTKITDLEMQLVVGTGSKRVDVSSAIKKIMNATETNGATLSALEKTTNLKREQLVLPIALLMKTDKLHFKTMGKSDLYVWKGKAPTEAPVKKKRKSSEESEEAPEGEETEGVPKKEPKRRPKKGEEEEEEEELQLDTTASVLVFGRKH